MIKNISNLGDSALYCDFGKEVNKDTNSNVINYFKFIKKKNIYGITNLSPSYNKLIISFDLSLTNFDNLKEEIKNIKPKAFEIEKSNNVLRSLFCLLSTSMRFKKDFT